jgi:hypothetical protein
MASLIPDFEYDIFISYHQKDNKHDGWVSDFVENLKGELESTFKEDISVYFDINPHHGLLETHDLDASLKEKLKCLVFIPVITRTYNDPKAFSWEHEFNTFVDQVAHDNFGFKVRLPNGNIASRVLPVQIQDLDPEDQSLLEKIFGGVLRSTEFIYKSAGVNRPLTTEDDDKLNLNKTKYRNQLNKAALTIKYIIQSIKAAYTSGKTIDKDTRADIWERLGKNTLTRRKFVKGVAGSAVCCACFSLDFLAASDKEQVDKIEDNKDNGHLAAVCGTYCGACPAYIAKHSVDEQIKMRLQKRFSSGPMKARKMIPDPGWMDGILCDGCLSGGQIASHCQRCAIKVCAANKQNVIRCSDCNELPCYRITNMINTGLLHRAEYLPNLEKIREMGVQEWVKYEEERWRCPRCGLPMSWYDAECVGCGEPRSEKLFPFV